MRSEKIGSYFNEDELSSDDSILICLPFAGGGASYYTGMQKAMKGKINVLPIQLPGRENRIPEEPLTECKAIANELKNELEPYLEGRHFSVFGHSMGGIIAFELSKTFEKTGLYPDVCFISATTIEDNSGIIRSSELNDEEFLERVMSFGGINKDSEILKYPEFQSIFMNILRADFNIVESYEYDGVKLKCPVAAICGSDDPSENIDNMHKWEEFTEREITYKVYSGDHFYIDNNLEELCGYIRDVIENEEKRGSI